MKRILFATTALVASATYASADVDLSGSAEMGIFGGDDLETQFHTDIDVTFSMSGETDGGLTFGASVDLDESIGDNNADDGLGESSATRDDSDDGGATMFVSGAFGTLTMGDTDGAYDFALTEVAAGGTLRDDHTAHAGYDLSAGMGGNPGLDGGYDGQIARYDYSFGDFGVAASIELDDNGVGDPIFGVGVNYSGVMGAMDFGAGLGYQTTDGADIIGVSLSGGMQNGFSGVLNYSQLDVDVGTDVDHTALGVTYETGPILVHANYGVHDFDGAGEDSGFGLAANYDLGGGASLQAGYGSSDFQNSSLDFDSFSLGMAMSF